MISLAITLLIGCCASAAQAALAEDVLRLHVVANSDSAEDQAVKLQVRDAVLAQAEPLLEGLVSSGQAEYVLTPRLAELEDTARGVLDAAGYDDDVTVTITDQWFPTRVYDSFSLPAGQYRALKVVIGEGAGQNWWCVVFPPLCMASVIEEVEAAAERGGLTAQQVALITGQDETYIIKFKIVEWWEQMVKKLRTPK